MRQGKSTTGNLMTQPVDMVGRVYGRLTVLGYLNSYHGKRIYACVCACGTKKAINGYNIRSGMTKSCGCAAVEQVAALHEAQRKNRTGEMSTTKNS